MSLKYEHKNIAYAKELRKNATAEEKHFFSRPLVEKMLGTQSFENITWQRTGLTTGVLIAWKAKPEAKQVRLEH